MGSKQWVLFTMVQHSEQIKKQPNRQIGNQAINKVSQRWKARKWGESLS